MDPVYAPIDDDYDLSDISPGNSVNSENVTIMQGREFNLPVSDGGVESGVQNNMFSFVPEEKSILKKIEENSKNYNQDIVFAKNEIGEWKQLRDKIENILGEKLCEYYGVEFLYPWTFKMRHF